jgi:ketosteroid isomerase-like protein
MTAEILAAMPTAIEQLVRESFDAFNDADWERMEPLYWPDAETKPPEGWPEGGDTNGWPEIRTQFERLKDSWAEDRFELRSFESLSEDAIFLEGIWHTRGKESGIEADVKSWVIAVARGERISRVEFYLDEAKAREAAARV